MNRAYITVVMLGPRHDHQLRNDTRPQPNALEENPHQNKIDSMECKSM